MPDDTDQLRQQIRDVIVEFENYTLSGGKTGVSFDKTITSVKHLVQSRERAAYQLGHDEAYAEIKKLRESAPGL